MVFDVVFKFYFVFEFVDQFSLFVGGYWGYLMGLVCGVGLVLCGDGLVGFDGVCFGFVMGWLCGVIIGFVVWGYCV